MGERETKCGLHEPHTIRPQSGCATVGLRRGDCDRAGSSQPPTAPELPPPVRPGPVPASRVLQGCPLSGSQA